MINSINQEIVETNRHLFIYGYNTKERKKLLGELIKNYPIKLDTNSPSAIYLDQFSLPIPENLNSTSDITLLMLTREYLNLSITYNILNAIQNQVDSIELENRVSKLLMLVNRLYVNKKLEKIKDLDELIQSLNTSKIVYLDCTKIYIDKGIIPKEKDNLQLPFIDLTAVVTYIKRLLNNNSYFAILLDCQEEVSKLSMRSINSLITKRCNADLSIKVVCEPEDWTTLYDLDNLLAEPLHDYGAVELDDSYSKYMKKLKKDFL